MISSLFWLPADLVVVAEPHGSLAMDDSDLGPSLAQQQFTVVDDSNKKAIKYRCSHCKHEFTANTVTRLVSHLLQNSTQVKKCVATTAAVKLVRKQLQQRLDTAQATAAAAKAIKDAAAAAKAGPARSTQATVASPFDTQPRPPHPAAERQRPLGWVLLMGVWLGPVCASHGGLYINGVMIIT